MCRGVKKPLGQGRQIHMQNMVQHLWEQMTSFCMIFGVQCNWLPSGRQQAPLWDGAILSKIMASACEATKDVGVKAHALLSCMTVSVGCWKSNKVVAANTIKFWSTYSLLIEFNCDSQNCSWLIYYTPLLFYNGIFMHPSNYVVHWKGYY